MWIFTHVNLNVRSKTVGKYLYYTFKCNSSSLFKSIIETDNKDYNRKYTTFFTISINVVFVLLLQIFLMVLHPIENSIKMNIGTKEKMPHFVNSIAQHVILI